MRSKGLVSQTTGDVIGLLDQDGLDPIPVEEQYREFYILHLSNSQEEVWIMVYGDSPLFRPLRDRHQEWMREHPNYRDWFAF